jgi:hypothetical protein
MKKVLLAGAALALAAACDSKPTWQARDVGALSLEFPCSPEQSAAVVKCSRPDGTEFSVATVDKQGQTPDQQLAETRAYVEGMPKSQLIDGSAFPLKWLEVRTNLAYVNWQWFKDGKEYTVRVAYTSPEPPPIVAEFFSKVRVK